MTRGEEKITRDQIVTNLGSDLKRISDQYDDMNYQIIQTYREDLKKELRAGREVTEDQLRLAKITRHDLEMRAKIDRIVEDPEKYFQEVREEARRKVDEEMREELLRPFKKVLGWLRRKDRNDNG